MRLATDWTLRDRDGERRVRRGFCLIPHGHRGWKYSRWLEWADFVDEIQPVDVGGSMCPVYRYKWVEVGFADDPDMRECAPLLKALTPGAKEG